LIELLAGALQVLARIAELPALVGHPLLILRLVHAILQFVGIAKLLLLLVAQAGQLPLRFFALRLRPGLLKRRLRFAHLAVDFFLALRQFAQAA
jgi:hypothetical protein